MADYTAPGVYVEEVPAQLAVTSAVSTSTMGIVGYTKRGPTNLATFISSPDEFYRTFGAIAQESRVGLSMAAFFANGGKNSYVVRVVPSDAVSATEEIRSLTSNQQIETGAAAVGPYSKIAGTTTLKVHAGASPIVPASVNLRWRAAAAAPVASQATVKRDGSTALVEIPSTANYEGRINPASLLAVDQNLDAIVPGSATIKFTLLVGGAKTIALSSSSGWIDSGVTGAGSSASLDRRTGRFSMLLAGAEIPAAGDVAAISMGFTATVACTAVDNGIGGWTSASLASGAISYTTGAYSFTTNAPAMPYTGSPILATYKIKAWHMDPISAGAWGNDLRVKITGAQDGYTATTGQFTLQNVTIQLKDSTGAYQTAETYEDVDFVNSTSAVYFPDVINGLSGLCTVVDPGGDEAPGELQAIPRSLVVAMGDGLAVSTVTSETTNTNVVLPNFPIVPRSVSITFVDSIGTTRTITDDGNGALIGAVDSTYATSVTVGAVVYLPNTISYTTGVFNFKTTNIPGVKQPILASYASVATETTHTEDFGDTTKSYTAGANGTTALLTRTQVSDITLRTTYAGIYAFDRLDDILQVIVPDFAGDLNVTGDLLDYAAYRATLASGGDRFIILTVPRASSAQYAVDWFKNQLMRFSDFAAIYWPWVKVADPFGNNRLMAFPPLGHVAGIYARTDATRNVGKSPAGTVDGALAFVKGLEMKPSEGEIGLVYSNKINALKSSTQTGTCVWGARTISSQSAWKYINARRLFMFLEKSVYNSTFWAVFENNGPALWSKLSVQLKGFMNNLFNQNYLAGDTPAQAYSVVVDSTNNSSGSIAAGQVIVDIQAAPNKPGEFIRMRFAQKTLE